MCVGAQIYALTGPRVGAAQVLPLGLGAPSPLVRVRRACVDAQLRGCLLACLRACVRARVVRCTRDMKRWSAGGRGGVGGAAVLLGGAGMGCARGRAAAGAEWLQERALDSDIALAARGGVPKGKGDVRVSAGDGGGDRPADCREGRAAAAERAGSGRCVADCACVFLCLCLRVRVWLHFAHLACLPALRSHSQPTRSSSTCPHK